MAAILSSLEVHNLKKETLFEFLALKMQEGSQIDYKENLSKNSKNEAYKEFLKDITAFANAHGGLLLLGVKEPSDDLMPKNQAIGIVEGDNISKDLERVAATSIDPRIPGLMIKPVHIINDKYSIVVFIPPSFVRPHMVVYQKHRSFYIRHSESSVPMTTHEIRDTVLSSATLESRARMYAQEEEIESLEYVIGENPAFLIQAVPLLSLEFPCNVLDKSIENIMTGENPNRQYKHDQFNLKSIRPTPTLKGILGRETQQNEPWLTEIHRTGYVQAIYKDIREKPDDPKVVALDVGYVDLFRAFCNICEGLWMVTQIDIPYLFRCNYFNAEKTAMFCKDRYGHNVFTNVYGRRKISLPEQMRQTGEPLDKIPDIWIERLFNAFGLTAPSII
jgi:hypothetical protein